MRRVPYSDLDKTDRHIPANVQGMGDVAFKGFQCPTGGCEAWIFKPADEFGETYSFECSVCGQTYGSGDSVKLFDYQLTKREDESIVEAGIFELNLDDYVGEAAEFKYCILCYELKPMEFFGRHAARTTHRQGECKQCKKKYNAIKNQSRIADQHREAAQKRRLVVELGATAHFDSGAVRARFGDRCFKCDRDVSGPGEAQFDHTLPARYFWPMTTQNATLLCREHNGQKGALWPSQFYADAELRKLALKTGFEYDLLADSQPTINPDAIVRLQDGDFVDGLFLKFAHYPDELCLVRNRILDLSGFDYFTSSANISRAWVERADQLRPKQSATASE